MSTNLTKGSKGTSMNATFGARTGIADIGASANQKVN